MFGVLMMQILLRVILALRKEMVGTGPGLCNLSDSMSVMGLGPIEPSWSANEDRLQAIEPWCEDDIGQRDNRWTLCRGELLEIMDSVEPAFV
ncbi:hypothetical protein QYF36_005697 [Acer negundo]|nr:hypothetical protein QYF36_005697 [Acer negundo]